MSNLDISKLTTNVLAQQQSEKRITEYKIFYKTHLQTIKQKKESLNELYPLCLKFQKIEPKTVFYQDKEILLLEIETKEIINKYFSPDILKLYEKEIPQPIKKNKIDFDKSFWQGLLESFSNTYVTLNEKIKQEWNYKTNFLVFLYNCLNQFGLHPDILRREANTYKRYNLVLEHYFKSKNKTSEHKILLTPDILQKDFLALYEKKFPIKIKGKLIPFNSIYSIHISSTLLLDDEIELYGLKNNFTWNNSIKDELKFISLCLDETDELLKNPFLLNNTEIYKNQNIYFVNPIRINELKLIRSESFDLTKLIQLCKELNDASVIKNNLSSSLLVRSIIDHVSPIFGFANFSSFANNYSGGTGSFKKSMLNLDKSLRNIADNNIHSQVRKKEVLPTSTQVDFTNELDLLLSEIVRTLK